MDIRVFRGAECGSDHFLLKAKCAWLWAQHKPTSTRGKGGAHKVDSVQLEDLPINIESLQDESTRWLYLNRINNEIEEDFD